MLTFLLVTSLKRRSTILTIFQKIFRGIKTPTKDELIILDSPLGPKWHAAFVEKKRNEQEKIDGIAEWMRIMVFHVEKLLQSANLFVLLENQYIIQSS